MVKKENGSVTLESIQQSIEGLARSTAKGFADVDRRFDDVDRRFGKVDNQIKEIHQDLGGIKVRLDGVERRLDTIVQDHQPRLKRLEKHLGLPVLL